MGKPIWRLLTSQVPCRQTLVVRKATLRLQGVTTPRRSLSTLWLLMKLIKTAIDKSFSATGVPANLLGDLLSPALCRRSLGHNASMCLQLRSAAHLQLSAYTDALEDAEAALQIDAR